MIRSDPNAIGVYTVRGDADLPAEKRRGFKVKFATLAQCWSVEEKLREVLKMKDSKARAFAALDAIAGHVVGWQNFLDSDGRETPFTPESVAARMHPDEFWEMIYQFNSATVISDDDRKNSESPA